MVAQSFAAPSRLRTVRYSRLLISLVAVSGLFSGKSAAQAQAGSSLLTSRAELTASADRAERAATQGDPASRARNALLAASIRQRLRNGDFRDGDHIVLSIFSDALHTDTLLVRSGGILDLPGNTALPLAGVLRSELRDRVESEVSKYVKAQQVEVIPLMRVGVMGQVARPGYFAVRSDIPITEAIMLAGGPSGAADVQRSVVRRGTQEFRSATDTREAISRGLTLDQFGLSAGDELVVGKERGGIGSSFLPWVGAVASVVTVFVALHR